MTHSQTCLCLPLTRREQPPVRWFHHLLPWHYNWLCRRRFEALLAERTHEAVEVAWGGSAVDTAFRREVSCLAAWYFHWANSSFLPSDECFVIFCGWAKGVGFPDPLEKAEFVMELEDLIAAEMPEHCLMGLYFGEFVETLWAIRIATSGLQGKEDGA